MLYRDEDNRRAGWSLWVYQYKRHADSTHSHFSIVNINILISAAHSSLKIAINKSAWLQNTFLAEKSRLMSLWVIKQMVPYTISLLSTVNVLVRLIHREHSRCGRPLQNTGLKCCTLHFNDYLLQSVVVPKPVAIEKEFDQSFLYLMSSVRGLILCAD